MTAYKDTGTYLEVPEDQRLDTDPDPAEVGEANDDAGADYSNVASGEYVALSTGSDDEPVGDGEAEDDDLDEYESAEDAERGEP